MTAKRICIAFVCTMALVATLSSIAGTAAEAPTAPAALELVVLGSGGPGATGRAASSYLVMIDGVARILVDAGPGAFARLGEAKLSLSAVDIVLLTHLHIDHTGELAGLFKAAAVSSGEPITYRVWGPTGSDPKTSGASFPSTTRFLELLFGKRGAYAYLSDFSAPITLQPHDIAVQIHPQPTAKLLLKEDGIAISAVAGHHRDAPAVIYRIDYAGKSITFSGDIDAQGLPGLRVLAQGTDLLVFNCVVLDPPGSPSVLYTLHTPPHVIGEIAKGAGVHKLLLSHLSPSVEGMRTQVLQSIQASYAGPVQFADDKAHVQP